MIKNLLSLWRKLPMRIHILAAWMMRPKFLLGVAALIFDEQGRVLLFKHTYRIFQWGLPAGGLEYGEEPEDALVREFYEETSLNLKVDKLLFMDVSKEFKRQATLIYLCNVVSGEFKSSLEISEIQYFDIEQLPRMLFAEKDLIRRVQKIIT